MNMSGFHKSCIAVLTAFLIVSLVVGVCTANSYLHPDPDEAVFSAQDRETAEAAIQRLNIKQLLRQLKHTDAIFLVTVVKNERSYQATKTIAFVDCVIKGDPEQTGREIVIYEPNYFEYNSETKQLIYHCINYINNITHPNQQYLFFVNSVPYAEAYQKTLSRDEYIVDYELDLYAFPLNEIIAPVGEQIEYSFSALRGHSFLCFNIDGAEKLMDIQKEILSYYELS